MGIFSEQNESKYVYIFADCQLAKGFTRTSVIDISRKRIFFVPNSYYELCSYFRQYRIREILDRLADEESRNLFYKFLVFLLKEKLAALVDVIARFPPINICWDHPSIITNAIIDVREEHAYLTKAITELSCLGCEYLQIRFYNTAPYSLVQHMATLIKNACFKDVEMLLKYDAGDYKEDFFLKLAESQKNLHFIFHSVPAGISLNKSAHIRYTRQVIASCNSCGLINHYAFSIPSIQGFMENKLFNSCLNRKIAIDENGNIGNCPSMKKKYGNISDHSLSDVVDKSDFKKVWRLNKDQIQTCKDCEFRYICSDCRAYTQEGKLYAKPAKCSYDPYTGTWEKTGMPDE